MPKNSHRIADSAVVDAMQSDSSSVIHLTMDEMREIVEFVLAKHARYSRPSGGFVDHIGDMLTLAPLDEDRKLPPDLGFLEDRIMMAHDFIVAKNKFADSLRNSSKSE